MSKTIASVIVLILVQLLPYFGVTLGNEQLTTAVETIITVVAGIIIWYRRVKIGDVKVFGVRKN